MDVKRLIELRKYDEIYDSIRPETEKSVIEQLAKYVDDDFYIYGIHRVGEIPIGTTDPMELFVEYSMKYRRNLDNMYFKCSYYLLEKAIEYKSTSYINIYKSRIFTGYKTDKVFIEFINTLITRLTSENDRYTIRWIIDKFDLVYPIELIKIYPKISTKLIKVYKYDSVKYIRILELLLELPLRYRSYLYKAICDKRRGINVYIFNDVICNIVPIVVGKINNGINPRFHKKILKAINSRYRTLIRGSIVGIQPKTHFSRINLSSNANVFIDKHRLYIRDNHDIVKYKHLQLLDWKCYSDINIDKLSKSSICKLVRINNHKFFESIWESLLHNNIRAARCIIKYYIRRYSVFPNIQLIFDNKLFNIAVSYRHTDYIRRYLADMSDIHINCNHKDMYWLWNTANVIWYGTLDIIKTYPSMSYDLAKQYNPMDIIKILVEHNKPYHIIYTLVRTLKSYDNILQIIPSVVNQTDRKFYDKLFELINDNCSKLYYCGNLDREIYITVSAIYKFHTGNIDKLDNCLDINHIFQYIKPTERHISIITKYMSIDDIKKTPYAYEIAALGYDLGELCDICAVSPGKELMIVKQNTSCKCNISYCVICYGKLNQICCICRKPIGLA